MGVLTTVSDGMRCVCVWVNVRFVLCGVQGSSTSGESVFLTSLLVALLRGDITWEPQGHARRPQLRVLGVGGAKAIDLAAMGHRGGLLGVVLKRVTTVIGVTLVLYRLFLLLLLFTTSMVVVVSHCSRVVGLIVGLIVGLVATMREWLDFGGGGGRGRYMGSVLVDVSGWS